VRQADEGDEEADPGRDGGPERRGHRIEDHLPHAQKRDRGPAQLRRHRGPAPLEVEQTLQHDGIMARGAC
jgi:hypothetical protein